MSRLGTIARTVRRLVRPKPDTSAGLRLHLGCGRDRWPGYVNIDSDPGSDADRCMDMKRVGAAFAPGTVDEIVLIHALGYLRLHEARAFLADAHRLLRPGGTLVLELPDLTKAARAALAAEGDEAAYLEAVRAFYAFSMDQVARGEPFTTYAFGWSAWHLDAELRRVGFARVDVLEPKTHGGRAWRDVRIEAVK